MPKELTLNTTTGTKAAAEVVAVRQLSHPVLVIASRTGRGWRAEVTALNVARTARTLHTLHEHVRELLGTDLVDYQFHTGDAELDRLVTQVRAARLAARTYEERARRLTEKVLMLPSAGPVRSLAVLVGLSYQRVHQLMQAQVSTVEGKQ